MRLNYLLGLFTILFFNNVVNAQTIDTERYYISDSDDPDGPSPAFVDIRTNGEFILGDERFEPDKVNIDLDQSFPYYNDTIDRISVSRFGYISTNLLDEGRDRDFCDKVGYDLDNPDGGLILVYHTRLRMFNSEGGGVWYRYFETSPVPKKNGEYMGANIIQWRGRYGLGQTHVNVQVVIFDDGEMLMQYDKDPGSSLSQLFFSSTTGLINPERTTFDKHNCKKEEEDANFPFAVYFERRELPSDEVCVNINGEVYSSQSTVSINDDPTKNDFAVDSIRINGTGIEIGKLSIRLEYQKEFDDNTLPLLGTRFFLQHAASGRNIQLVNSGDNVLFNLCALNGGVNAVFTDDAPEKASCNNVTQNAIQGFVQPTEPLSTFEGLPFDGFWRLVVDPEPDSLAALYPTLNFSWCLIVDPLEEKDCSPIDDVISSDFNSGADGWTASPIDGTDTLFELAQPATPFLDNDAAGLGNTWITNFDGNYPNGAHAQVVSPEFSLKGMCSAFIEFDAAFDTEFEKDGFVIQISEDDGATWMNVGNFGDDNWYNVSALRVEVIGAGAGDQNFAHFSGKRSLRKYSHDLNDYVGKENLKIRFAFRSDDEMVKEGFFFDNVKIGGSKPQLVELEADNNLCESEERVEITASPKGGTFEGPGIITVDQDTFNIPSGAINVPIPDLGTAEYTFEVDSSQFGDEIENFDLNDGVSLEFLDLFIQHQYVNDLQIILVTPNGDSTTIADRIGKSPSNPLGCGFSNLDVTVVKGTGLSIDSFCLDQFIAATGVVTASNSDKGLQGLFGTAIGEYKLIVRDLNSDPVPAANAILEVNPTFVVRGRNFFDPALAGVGEHDINYEYISFTNDTFFNSVTVNVFPQADATFEANDFVCINQDPYDIIPVEEGGVFSGPGIIDETEGLFDPKAVGIGSYDITYIRDVINSCNDTFTKTIIVDYGVFAEAGDNFNDVCFGTPLQIGGNPTAEPDSNKINPSFFFTYDWTPKEGFVDVNGDTEANPTVTPAEDITYTVKVTDTFGCFDFDTVSITQVRNKPFAYAGDDQLLCTGNSVSLGGNPTAEGGVAPYTFDWRLLDSTIVSNERNPEVSPLITTTYVLHLTDNLGCTDSDTVEITVVPNPTVEVDQDTTICEGTSVSFTAIVNSGTGPYSYSWTPTIGLDNFDQQTVEATASSLSAIYKVEVTDANGCIATDNVTLDVIQAPTADAGDDQEMCDNATILNQGDTIRLPIIGGSPAGTPAGVLYSWSPRSDIYNDNFTAANPRVRQLSNTTIFTLEVEDPTTGCTATDQVRVTVNEAPTLNLDADEEVCNGSSVEIGAVDMVSGGVPAYTYTWLPAATLDDPTKPNPTATPDQSPEFYTVYVTDAKGCTQIGQVTVTQVEPEVGVFNNLPDEVCQNVFDIFLNANPPGGNFSGDGVVNGLFKPELIDSNSLAVVTYEVFDNQGCFISITKEVLVKDAPEVIASDDTTIYKRDSAYLFAVANVPSSYRWEPAASVVDPNLSNVTVFPLETTLYTVTATAANGCAQEEIVVVAVDAQPAIKGIPNTFTPNGDGVNDRWIIDYLLDYPNNNVAVYNRWGQLIFEQADYSEATAWDGGDLAEDVYYYVITIGDNDNNPKRGYITIVK